MLCALITGPAKAATFASSLVRTYASRTGRSAQGLDRSYDTLTTFARNPWVRCLRDAARAAQGRTSVVGLDGARGIALSPDGTSVYVASGEGDALAVRVP